MSTFVIEFRRQIEINTDPQRRCYNGGHFSSEWIWSSWEILDDEVPEDKVEHKLAFWRELNDYAVSARGAGARCEFRAVPEGRES